MYEIVTHDEAIAQLDDLPAHLAAAYVEARAALELAPWSAGASSRPQNPEANVYTLDFGRGSDVATLWYLIQERERVVHILEVLWL